MTSAHEADRQGDAGPETEFLDVFVYGTLKQGFENHAAYCRGAIGVRSAWTWGRLHLWSERIPILDVPQPQVLMHGSGDLAADLRAAQALALAGLAPDPMKLEDGGRWRRVRGQVIRFPDPERRLAVFDAFEGFRPRTSAHYGRVLLNVCTDATRWERECVQAAWAYVVPLGEDPPGDPLPAETWDPAPSR